MLLYVKYKDFIEQKGVLTCYNIVFHSNRFLYMDYRLVKV